MEKLIIETSWQLLEMNLSKIKIEKYILNYLHKEIKKKRIKMKFNLKKVDFLNAGIIDSLGFLNLISFLEKKFSTEIDLSNENPNNLTKINKLTKTIFKNLKK